MNRLNWKCAVSGIVLMLLFSNASYGTAKGFTQHIYWTESGQVYTLEAHYNFVTIDSFQEPNPDPSLPPVSIIVTGMDLDHVETKINGQLVSSEPDLTASQKGDVNRITEADFPLLASPQVFQSGDPTAAVNCHGHAFGMDLWVQNGNEGHYYNRKYDMDFGTCDVGALVAHNKFFTAVLNSPA